MNRLPVGSLFGRIGGHDPQGRPPKTWIEYARQGLLYLSGFSAQGVWDIHRLVRLVRSLRLPVLASLLEPRREGARASPIILIDRIDVRWVIQHVNESFADVSGVAHCSRNPGVQQRTSRLKDMLCLVFTVDRCPTNWGTRVNSKHQAEHAFQTEGVQGITSQCGSATSFCFPYILVLTKLGET